MRPFDFDRERAPAAADLEQRAQRLFACHRADPRRNRAVALRQQSKVSRLERLGNLSPAAQTWIDSRRRAELFQRRFEADVLPAAASPNPQRIARAVEASVLRIEVDVELAGATPRLDLERAVLGLFVALFEPTNHRPEIDRVELPLNLSRVHDNPSLAAGLAGCQIGAARTPVGPTVVDEAEVAKSLVHEDERRRWLGACGHARQKSDADAFAEAAIGYPHGRLQESLHGRENDRSGRERMRPCKVDSRSLRPLQGPEPAQLLERFLEALRIKLLDAHPPQRAGGSPGCQSNRRHGWRQRLHCGGGLVPCLVELTAHGRVGAQAALRQAQRAKLDRAQPSGAGAHIITRSSKVQGP